MRKFILEIFTWWNGQTLGTRFFTWRKGKKVGKDEDGNTYYQSCEDRRWVIYHGPIEATRIPVRWHSWIHHRTDLVPSNTDHGDGERNGKMRHNKNKENKTGRSQVYNPNISIAGQKKENAGAGDYEAWTP
ncbi:NADH:ubiquinone oxidoreductase subunit NDUFA12 [Candidatus Endowatersipora endosymbiont of Watersipora subatra]|uniref:NADH:ubiquinone oxidoreductase subunit NDUFA12 n=1 Tax=Candidatus Endowatersipora endosymbiont of Watersipora subatra TaxID=3077946 RepID=UPI00312C7571